MASNDNSAQPCGCDPGMGWVCEYHMSNANGGTELRDVIPPKSKKDSILGSVDSERKKIPLWSGFLMYFPLAWIEVARVSFIGNEQHNPGEPLHWAREKSTDQMNTAIRHLIDHGTGSEMDTDGTMHLAKAIWRLSAELQLVMEKRRKK